MRKKLFALLAALLAFALLFAACAPLAPAEPLPPEGTEYDFDLTVVPGEPTDETPQDTRANAPPEETGDAAGTDEAQSTAAPGAQDAKLDENGVYTSKEDVALYIHTYGRLPQNFITKKEAEKLGWNGGSLEKYAPGKCIGGSRFGNYEGLLPEKSGRTYYECDIDTLGARSRGAKRIVFSNDGLIYYTENHYETFTLLYGGN